MVGQRNSPTNPERACRSLGAAPTAAFSALATRSAVSAILYGVPCRVPERGPMTRVTRNNRISCIGLLAAMLLLICSTAPTRAQVAAPAFLAEHYDVTANLDTISQSLSAVAKVEFKAVEVSGAVRVELHPNLDVKSVTGADGKALSFERDNQNSLYGTVNLNTPVAVGAKVTLTFTYAGLLANEQNSPIPGVKAAVVNKDGAYLLLPGRWFPLTNYPSNRYTGTFRLNVPDSFAVAGTGKAGSPTPMAGKTTVEGNRLLYTFVCDSPAPHGTFVAGELKFNPQQAEGVNVAVYAPPSAPNNAADFAAGGGGSVAGV